MENPDTKIVLNIVLLLTMLFTSCKQPQDIHTFHIFENLSFNIKLSNHCSYPEKYGNGYGISGIKFSCPFEYQKLEIIVGVANEKKDFEDLENIDKEEYLRGIRIKNDNCSGLEVRSDNLYYICKDSTRVTLYYERYIKIQEFQYLEVKIKRGVSPDRYEAELEEVKSIAESIELNRSF